MQRVIAVDFQKSRTAQETRQIRAIIRQAPVTKSERDVMMAVANLWFYHRGKGHGIMHPGRAKIAKKSGVSLRTVDRAVVGLRDQGILVPVAYAKGGGKCATHFRMDLDRLRAVFDPSGVTEKAGELIKMATL